MTRETPNVTVSQYHRMIDAGFFAPDERFELLEGAIAARPTRDPPNAAVSNILREELDARLAPRWHTRTYAGFTTADSEPEPSAVVVRGGPRDYMTRHPGAADTALVAEVSNVRLELDRTIKERIYARARVAVYWIVNLVDERVEVYNDPSGVGDVARYLRRSYFVRGQSVPFLVDGVIRDPVPVSNLLP